MGVESEKEARTDGSPAAAVGAFCRTAQMLSTWDAIWRLTKSLKSAGRRCLSGSVTDPGISFVFKRDARLRHVRSGERLEKAAVEVVEMGKSLSRRSASRLAR